MNHLEWRRALRSSSVDSTAKGVGFVLNTYADGEGRCWPSRETIAAGASYDVRTVDQAIRRLEHRGFLRVVRTKGRTSNRYYLSVPNGEGDSRLTGYELRRNPEPREAETANLATANGDAGSPEAASKQPVKTEDDEHHVLEAEHLVASADARKFLEQLRRGDHVLREMPA